MSGGRGPSCWTRVLSWMALAAVLVLAKASAAPASATTTEQEKGAHQGADGEDRSPGHSLLARQPLLGLHDWQPLAHAAPTAPPPRQIKIPEKSYEECVAICQRVDSALSQSPTTMPSPSSRDRSRRSDKLVLPVGGGSVLLFLIILYMCCRRRGD